MQITQRVLCLHGVDEILTLGPGDPTLPAAPGKPVAPCQKQVLDILNTVSKFLT